MEILQLICHYTNYLQKRFLNSFYHKQNVKIFNSQIQESFKIGIKTYY